MTVDEMKELAHARAVRQFGRENKPYVDMTALPFWPSVCGARQEILAMCYQEKSLVDLARYAQTEFAAVCDSWERFRAIDICDRETPIPDADFFWRVVMRAYRVQELFAICREKLEEIQHATEQQQFVAAENLGSFRTYKPSKGVFE